MSVKRKVTIPAGSAEGRSGECNLHRLVDAEAPAFVVPLGMSTGRGPAPIFVKAPPAQREAEPLFVGLDEAPQQRCLLEVAALGSPRGEPGKGVADEPIGTRVPGNAQGVAIVPLGGFRIVRVQVEVTEGVERARRAEMIVARRPTDRRTRAAGAGRGRGRRRRPPAGPAGAERAGDRRVARASDGGSQPQPEARPPPQGGPAPSVRGRPWSATTRSPPRTRACGRGRAPLAPKPSHARSRSARRRPSPPSPALSPDLVGDRLRSRQ